ncbi:MAG TPA: glycosyltransferase family 2 protein [Gemmatimonadaceae bacterium]|nr:glycosyltransferase family 2 protein [Gemmatimonadaceae bacterium]
MHAAPLLWTFPWVLPPLVGLFRARRTTPLDLYDVDAGAGAPFVSVVVPARDERRNIERCVRSVLSARYPAFEVIVVDDHSTDGTGEVARAIAAGDDRLRVVDAPPLPESWFGKQWACATGARASRGDLLLFTDADTTHAPDLMPRAVNAMRARNADLLSVAGHQEMHSFWERVVQPQMFALLALRYGGGEAVSNTRRPEDAIANGQFILMRREAYAEMGGHALVRDRVAEDLALAQEFVRAGRRIALLSGIDQLSTHMYASLSEVIGGWRKNIYAGGRNAALGGALGRFLYPFLLLALPFVGLIPVGALLLSLAGVLSSAWFVWSGIVVGMSLLYWSAVYRFAGEPPWYAVVYPLGLAMFGYIAAGAVARGRRVEWKSRRYQSR